MLRAPAGSDVQLLADRAALGEAAPVERRGVEAIEAAERDQLGQRLPGAVGLHHAAPAEGVRLEDARRGGAQDRAAVGAYLVESRPARDMARPLASAHPVVQARPDLLHEKLLAVVVEVIAGR